MSKPLAIDLFCGLGGWTEGLLAEGYNVVGFDIERHDYGTGGYPAQLVLQDVLTLHGAQFKDAALIVASPPCQAYSYRAMPWKRAKALPPPSNELFEACFRIQREASQAAGCVIPLVVENVKGAQPWVGRARWHYGSFYLWGDVPALMPHTLGGVMKRGVAHRANGDSPAVESLDRADLPAMTALEDARAKYIDADFMAVARPLDPGAQQYRREAYAAWLAAVPAITKNQAVRCPHAGSPPLREGIVLMSESALPFAHSRILNTEVGVLKPGIAIPTEFRGIKYRSRLEANVAQFLLDIGCKFEYETKSFFVNGRHYAPDFYLSEQNVYVEARGYLTETSEATLEAFTAIQGGLFVFYSDRAEYLSIFQGQVCRLDMCVCICDWTHCSIATLGSKCWLCKALEVPGPHRSSVMDVVMRSGMPTLITEYGKTLQGMYEDEE